MGRVKRMTREPPWDLPGVRLTFNTALRARSSPVVANGVAYVSSDKMYALNAATGAKLWSSTITAGSAPRSRTGWSMSARTRCTRSTLRNLPAIQRVRFQAYRAVLRRERPVLRDCPCTGRRVLEKFAEPGIQPDALPGASVVCPVMLAAGAPALPVGGVAWGEHWSDDTSGGVR